MKRAVFLIHGFMTDKNDFSRLIPLLKMRFEGVFCPNLPGHGEGVRTPMKSAEVLKFVVDTFDEISKHYDVIDVIGFSMGGALATHLSKIRKINRLVLVAPANKFISGTYLFSTIKYFLEKNPKKHKEYIESCNDEECASNFDDVLKDTQDALKMFVKSLLPRYSLNNLTQFTKVIYNCNKNLKCIDVPMLIIWGELDQLVPHASCARLFGICTNPTKTKLIYRDMSHYMLFSRAAYRIIYDILCFLEQPQIPAKCGRQDSATRC